MRKRLVAALSACLVLGTLAACTPEPIVSIPSSSLSEEAPVLTISAPVSPSGASAQEGILVSQVYAAAIKAAGIQAVVEAAQATAKDQISSLKTGSSDIAPAYSRELLESLEPSVEAESAADVVNALKKALPEGISMLDAAKAQDSDNLVVTAATAEKYQLKSIEDLAKVCKTLVLGGPAGFQLSSRGLAGLGSDYNCVPKKYVALEPLFDGSKEDVLWALLRDEIQVADIHSSAPSIVDNALVPLTDTKQLFPAQNVVPLVDSKTVPPEVQKIINKVSAALTTEELANLSRLAQDRHFGDVSEVATAWLSQVGLVKAVS